MNGKIGKKRIILVLSLICVGVLILTVYLVNTGKPSYSPFKHEFNSKTGVVTFKLDQRYSFDSIQLSLGNFPQPIFDSETSEVSFNVFDLPVGKYDFVYIVAHNRDTTEQKGVEFEIVHQSGNEILIQEFRNGVTFPGYRHTYTYSY